MALSGNHRPARRCLSSEPCSASPYGRIVYTTFQENLRLFRSPPRNSAIWRKQYKKRSAYQTSVRNATITCNRSGFAVRNIGNFRTFIAAAPIY
ncbi:hypothetical protein CEB3_c10340 [Peptococcaceae bacterium CEB3]|nr:hypothetical protein CEB3_c10340 [Peptococcaceae bacterium CEB3]